MHKNLIDNDLEILDANQANYIIGIDEVGRGSLAGPIVGAAVLFDAQKLAKLIQDNISPKIFDSKKISKKERIELAKYTTENCLFCHIVERSNQFIDKHGIQKANIEVMVEGFEYCIDHIFHTREEMSARNLVISGELSIAINNASKILAISDHLDIQKQITVNKKKQFQNFTFLHPSKADSTYFTVACASLIAKEYRDNLMRTTSHQKYPDYGFDTHVGYGTKKHIEQIKLHGICQIHRKSFVKNS